MFISYAQNFEDVLLHRALKDIRNGFYVDIGAQDPVLDSVSMGFYRLGWRGVHVEPVPAFASALRKERPDETVIEAAVGEAVGNIAFYEIVNTGMSTASADAAFRHVANGFRSEVRSVVGIRLAEILDAQRGHDIHWLKIDVEGQELSVIRSWQPSEVRPWIVVAESVDPFHHQDNSAEWEPELLALGYTFAYFDGLNRFYVSTAHPELMGSFGIGANLFDDFTLSGTSSSPFCNVLKSQLEILSVREVEVLRGRISDFERSRSWRLTAPIRGASRVAKRGIGLSRRILRALLQR
jgi:FkbM family methyltransferase